MSFVDEPHFASEEHRRLHDRLFHLQDRKVVSPTAVTCPKCGATPGKGCQTVWGKNLDSYHQERREAASQ